jgi:short subunit dehydrogenase-like uncharacterized protein
MTREHDLVIYGATGYVGALITDYLARAAPAGARIALGGRSRQRLESLQAKLSGAARDWPLVVADAADPIAMENLAASTKVVATTVGPYARYGIGLVEACATAGTHYADLTGETLFHRDMIDKFDKTAQDSGARIVHSCGFDSIPSDLGVLMLHERTLEDGTGPLVEVRTTAFMRGGFSGGTLDTLRVTLEEAKQPDRRRILGDPYGLSPNRSAEPDLRQPTDMPRPAKRGSTWTGPFVMASYNTRVVRRSNALQDWAYGRDLRYGEVAGYGGGVSGAATAFGFTAGLGGLVAAMRLPVARQLADRLLPKPGEGPSAKARERGWFRFSLLGTTAGGQSYRGTVAGQGDPGYLATAVMFAESGLCLAFDQLPARAGCLTPATAMGSALTARLRAAGHTYEVTPAP